MKLKRGRIPTKSVPCPKCKSPIDLSQYTEADIETEQPLTGLAKRLRPAAELLKTIIPQARIFDRSKNRKRKIEGTPKIGPGFHLQKGGANDEVALPEKGFTAEKPSGSVVGRITAPRKSEPSKNPEDLEDLENIEDIEALDPIDLRKTPAMGLEAARKLFPVEDSVDLLDSGVLVKGPDSVEIGLGRAMPRHTPAPTLDTDSEVEISPELLSDMIASDAAGAMAEPPALPTLPTPAEAVSEHVSNADQPILPQLPKPAEVVSEHVSKTDQLGLPQLPRLAPPKIQAPKLGAVDLKALPQTPSFKLPAPISGLSESSEPREDVMSESSVELSASLRNAVEKQRFETERPAQEQSLEMIRNASFSTELEREQADSFFKTSVEVAESMEFEMEEFDHQQGSRAPISLLAAIILILVVIASVIGFITLT